MAEDLIDRSKEVAQAKTGESAPMPTEELSILDQTRQMQTNMNAMLLQMNEERQKMERLASDIMLSGRGRAGQIVKEKSQEEKDQETADKMLKMLGRGK